MWVVISSREWGLWMGFEGEGRGGGGVAMVVVENRRGVVVMV